LSRFIEACKDQRCVVMSGEALQGLVEEIEALKADDLCAQELRDKALAAAQAGRLEEAKSLVTSLIEAQTPAAIVAEKLLGMTAGAEAALGWISAAQLRHADAAAHFRLACRSLPARDDERRCRYIEAEADSQERWARERGNSEACRQAILLRKQLLAEISRHHELTQWIIQQNKLGNALYWLGIQERDRLMFEEAAAAYRAALEALPADKTLLSWAMVQSNFADALARAGEYDRGSERLEEAIEAYRLVLDRVSREHVPREWGTLQHNLGRALFLLGARTNSAIRLEEAVTAYQAALGERTSEGASLDWAITQASIADALLSLAVREGGTTQLAEAITIYGSALIVLESEKASDSAAKVRQNLTEAECLLARRTGQGGTS
jgi:tetratricopeptide (TPR) repeat protein